MPKHDNQPRHYKQPKPVRATDTDAPEQSESRAYQAYTALVAALFSEPGVSLTYRGIKERTGDSPHLFDIVRALAIGDNAILEIDESNPKITVIRSITPETLAAKREAELEAARKVVYSRDVDFIFSPLPRPARFGDWK